MNQLRTQSVKTQCEKSLRHYVKISHGKFFNYLQKKYQLGVNGHIKSNILVKGEIDRYMAKLMAQVYTHTLRVDYYEMFAPIVKMNIILMLLWVAAIKEQNLHQLDINNVFLHGDLHEKIYMEIPQGSHTSNHDKNLVYRLKKSFYRLKQCIPNWIS